MKKLISKIDTRVIYVLFMLSALAAASAAPYAWSMP